MKGMMIFEWTGRILRHSTREPAGVVGGCVGGWVDGWLVRLLDVACVSWVAYKAVCVGSKQTGILGLHNSQKVCQVWLCICCFCCFVVANLDMQNKGTLQCQVKFIHSWTLCSVLGQQFIGKFQAPSTLSRLFHYCDRWWVMAMPNRIIIVPVTRHDHPRVVLISSPVEFVAGPIDSSTSMDIRITCCLGGGVGLGNVIVGLRI